MELPHFLLAGSLLLIGTSFAQPPATQGGRTAKDDPSRGGRFSSSYRGAKYFPTKLAPRPARLAPACWVALTPTHCDFTGQLPATPRTGLHLELVNVLGSVVFRRALPLAAQFTVPAGVVPVGLYWVRLHGPQGYLATQRVVLN